MICCQRGSDFTRINVVFLNDDEVTVCKKKQGDEDLGQTQPNFSRTSVGSFSLSLVVAVWESFLLRISSKGNLSERIASINSN